MKRWSEFLFLGPKREGSWVGWPKVGTGVGAAGAAGLSVRSITVPGVLKLLLLLFAKAD